MTLVKKTCCQLLLFAGFYSSATFSTTNVLPNLPAWLKQGHTIVELGGFWSDQGQAQHIDIDGLIGDEFTVTNHNDSNGLVGLGLMALPRSAYYLFKTTSSHVIH